MAHLEKFELSAAAVGRRRRWVLWTRTIGAAWGHSSNYAISIPSRWSRDFKGLDLLGGQRRLLTRENQYDSISALCIFKLPTGRSINCGGVKWRWRLALKGMGGTEFVTIRCHWVCISHACTCLLPCRRRHKFPEQTPHWVHKACCKKTSINEWAWS